ncbi:hypothetical protein A9Q86_09955 [Flavobacteriales bacterium 33_180_T64]|nr:hypothetical protein A9Q86_09955 [Flavobacteriales bacterium 33_180_T64]
MYKSLFIVIATLLFSCTDDPKEEEKYPKNLFSIIQEGKSVEDTYTFCSTIPQEINFSYRIGIWIIKTKNGKKIAKGEYDIEIITIDDQGGCSFSYKVNTVDINKWEFWDSEGVTIEPTKRLISLVKLYTSKR